MVKIIARGVSHSAQAIPQILYIGQNERELLPVVGLVEGLAIIAANTVELGLAHARQTRFDTLIFDQRDPALASKLIVPLIEALGYPANMVVVSEFGNLGAYLKIPSVAAVLAAPMRAQHVLRVLGLRITAKPRVRDMNNIKLTPIPGASPMAPRREIACAS